MDTNRIAAPLMARSQDGRSVEQGTGFLVEIDEQMYLVTVAHLATGQTSQSDDWAAWADGVHYAPDGKSAATIPLFDAGVFGERRPRFKFRRADDIPSVLVDLILLPLEPGHPVSRVCEIFRLSTDGVRTYTQGQALSMVGFEPWPDPNVQRHKLVAPGIVHKVLPPQRKGFSGCPVIDSEGLLVGMAYGTEEANHSGHGLVVAVELIAKAARAIDGFS